MKKGVKIGVFSVLALALVLVIVLIVVDGLSNNHYEFINNTDKDITYLCVSFEDDSYELYDEIYEGELKKGETVTGKYSTLDFTTCDRFCCAYVDFDGEEEIVVSDGYFEGKFRGKIVLEFYQEDGEYRIKMRSGVGPSMDDSVSGMDSDIYFDFENSDWNYVGDFIDFEDIGLDVLDLDEMDLEDLDWEVEE